MIVEHVVLTVLRLACSTFLCSGNYLQQQDYSGYTWVEDRYEGICSSNDSEIYI